MIHLLAAVQSTRLIFHILKLHHLIENQRPSVYSSIYVSRSFLSNIYDRELIMRIQNNKNNVYYLIEISHIY